MDKATFNYLKDLDEDINSSNQLINFIKKTEIKQLTFTGNETAFNFILEQEKLNKLINQINKLLEENTKKYSKEFNIVLDKETLTKAKRIRKKLLGFVINASNDEKSSTNT